MITLVAKKFGNNKNQKICWLPLPAGRHGPLLQLPSTLTATLTSPLGAQGHVPSIMAF
jgi:hypothetical protein